MPKPPLHLADIDAAIAKGQWWLRQLDELAEAGVELAGAVAAEMTAGRMRASAAADDYERTFTAVQRAMATSLRL